jgi:hypothetical protein
MSEQQAPTKEELLEALRGSGRELAGTMRGLPADVFEQGRYESGWNGRQILAHIASIEWTYPRLLDIAKEAPAEAQPAPVGASGSESGAPAGPPTRPVQGGIMSYNDRQVEKRASATVEELIAEFEKNRAATIAAVEAADASLFEREIRSAGGVTGALSNVIKAIAVDHVLAHAGDISGKPYTGR